MGGHSSTSTETKSTENVKESNFQDTGGLTIQGNRGATTVQSFSTSTDAGAVKAALAANSTVAGTAILANSDVSQAAIDLGGQALTEGNAVATAGLDNAAAAYESGLTFGTNALDTVQNLAAEFSHQNADLTNSALSGYQSIAQQNSATDSTQIQKIALWAIGAAVLIVLVTSGRVKM